MSHEETLGITFGLVFGIGFVVWLILVAVLLIFVCRKGKAGCGDSPYVESKTTAAIYFILNLPIPIPTFGGLGTLLAACFSPYTDDRDYIPLAILQMLVPFYGLFTACHMWTSAGTSSAAAPDPFDLAVQEFRVDPESESKRFILRM